MDESLKKLKQDFVDLYLIHWPTPKLNNFVERWRALIKIKEEGLAKSIGVSNFNPNHLEKIIDETGVKPVLNQIELSPYLQQDSVRKYCFEQGIVPEAWSPLGRGNVLADEKIVKIAEKLGKTPAQVVLRWHIQLGNIVIPKSVTPERIRSNFDVFSFELDEQDMKEIKGLDKGIRIGSDPEDFNN
jgi:2,5-diketo-D-gluconate reductase A